MFELFKKTYETYDETISIESLNIFVMLYETLGKYTSYLNEDGNICSTTVKEDIKLFRVKIDLDKVIRDNGSNIFSIKKHRIESAYTFGTEYAYYCT